MPDIAGNMMDRMNETITTWDNPDPFTCLGHDRQWFFFMTNRGGQVLSVKGKDLGTHATLIQLAPSEWWGMRFESEKEFCNVKAAVEDLVKRSYEIGIYDPMRIRGRGAWLDGSDVIMHLGDRMIVNGLPIKPHARKSPHVYEMSRALPADLSREPLSNKEASRLIDLCVACGWEQPEGMGRILAGWIVVAMVCGAMPWRPHLWVSGEAGCGKTWVIKNVVRPAVGSVALVVEGKTTEPGIRGELGADARPVLFDEPETQNRADRERVQQVIDLARHASSEDGAQVLKGKAGGDGVNRAHIRSCFCFSAINVGMTQAADETRTMMLTMRVPKNGPERETRFHALKQQAAETLTDGFSGRLLTRSLRLVPVIRANAEVFAKAISERSGSRRMGDTLGVLLAGAWSLTSEKVLTEAEATDVVKRHGWVGQAADSAEVVPEWRRALDHLMQAKVEVTPSNSRPERVPVSELIDIMCPSDVVEDVPVVVSAIEAKRALGRFGIVVTDGSVRFANTSTAIGAAFAGTPWEQAWRATILRAPEAEKGPAPARGLSSQRFGPMPAAYVQIAAATVLPVD